MVSAELSVLQSVVVSDVRSVRGLVAVSVPVSVLVSVTVHLLDVVVDVVPDLVRGMVPASSASVLPVLYLHTGRYTGILLENSGPVVTTHRHNTSHRIPPRRSDLDGTRR
jgi:hypothetical protein